MEPRSITVTALKSLTAGMAINNWRFLVALPLSDDQNKRPPLAGRKYQTFAGTICDGMEVIGASGEVLGHVSGVAGDSIVLSEKDPAGKGDFSLPLSLIDGISNGQVLLASRGDATFGIAGQS